MHKSHRFDIKKIQKFSGEGATPRPHPEWGGGYPLPTPHPSRRLDSRAPKLDLGLLGAFGASSLNPPH